MSDSGVTIRNGQGKRDNWVDIAGYAACGAGVRSAGGCGERAMMIGEKEAREMYDEYVHDLTKTVKQIAGEHFCSEATVRKTFKFYGLERVRGNGRGRHAYLISREMAGDIARQRARGVRWKVLEESYGMAYDTMYGALRRYGLYAGPMRGYR